MKTKVLNRLIICILLVSSILFATACGETKEEAPIHPIQITISINYPEVSKIVDIEDAPFKLEEDSTVLDAIQLYCNVNEIPVTVETTDGSVAGINSVNNGDFYANRVWTYKLNDKFGSDPENTKVLKDGDVLNWVYKK